MQGGWLRYMRRQDAFGCDVAGLVEGGRDESEEEDASSGEESAPEAGKDMQRSQCHSSGPGWPASQSSREGGRLTRTGDTVG